MGKRKGAHIKYRREIYTSGGIYISSKIHVKENGESKEMAPSLPFARARAKVNAQQHAKANANSNAHSHPHPQNHTRERARARGVSPHGLHSVSM